MQGSTKWLAVAVAGCGLGAVIVAPRAHRELAPPTVPAPPAAEASIPGSGRATVAVYDEGLPFAKRPVVFQDGRGEIRAVLETGADGKASFDVASGDMVTVAYGGPSFELLTILDVRPGDELVVGEKEPDAKHRVVGTVVPKLPGAHPGATEYALSVGVGTTSEKDVTARTTLQILDAYLGRGAFTVVAEAIGDRGEALAYSLQEVTKSAAMASSTVTARLPAWRRDWRAIDVELASAPESASSADVQISIPTDPGSLVKRSRRLPLGGRATTHARFDLPKGVGHALVVDVDVDHGAGSRSRWTRRLEDVPGSVKVELDELLPRVSNAAVLATTTRERPEVSWEIAGGSTATADAAIAVVRWPENAAHRWTIVGPPTKKTPWRLPSLPASLRDWQPSGEPSTAAVMLIESSEIDGYDDVRREGLQELEEAPDEPMSVRISSVGDLEH